MLKPAAPGTGITVGQLAEAAEVNVETIRYYQRIGLLPLPKKDHGSIRRYSADDLKRLRFVKRAQALGFSLSEVALLLGLSDGKHCAETKMLAEKKLARVEAKISDLAADKIVFIQQANLPEQVGADQDRRSGHIINCIWSCAG